MSDFEQRLSQTLDGRAEHAPGAEGLARAARRRHARRRNARMAGAGVAALALAIGVPFALGGLSLGDADPPLAGQGKEPRAHAVPREWRFESYRNVEFAIPPDWGHGSLDDWCAGGGGVEESGRVERPGGAALSIGCPSSGYGVRVDGEGVATPPPGAVVREAEAGGIPIVVVATSEEVADIVAGSLREIPGQDFHSCDPAKAVPPLGAMESSSTLGRGGVVTMCRYELGVEGPNLVDSEGVGEADDESFWLGLESAEKGKGPDSGPRTCTDSPETEAVLVKTGGEDYAWVHYSGCDGHGIDIGGTTYKLNAQVTYWTLPRGSFAVDGSVPLPKEQRR